MSEAATITPASFNNSTGNSTTTRTVQPQNPEYVAKQAADTADIFDTPGVEAEFQTDDNKQQTQQTPAATPATPDPNAPVAPASTGTDPATLSSAMVQALKEAGFAPQQQQQQQAPAQLSPEEYNKLTNHFEVTPEFLATLDDPDPVQRAANFNNFVDGIRKNTLTMAYHMVQNLKSEMLAQVQPLVQQTEQQRTQAMQQEFSSKYPALANPAFQPILSAALSEAKASGKRFANQDEAFKYIAETAANTIKAVNPAFELGVPSTTPTKQNSTTMPAPNGSPSGGGGGAGNSTRKKVPATVGSGVEVFD